MRLTWKDLVVTLFMGGIVAVYVVYLNGTSAWLISSARGTTTAVLVLGFVGGCVLGGLADAYTGAKSRSGLALTVVATILGLTALTAAVVGLVTGGTVALAVLVAATLALWLVATIRHAFFAPAGPAPRREAHEAMHPAEMATR
ncbi:MAG TPA: hypothetical protein VF162_06685 [Streptosporangiaceae bacterium]